MSESAYRTLCMGCHRPVPIGYGSCPSRICSEGPTSSLAPDEEALCDHGFYAEACGDCKDEDR